MLSNVRHRAMITPGGPPLTRLIQIRPNYWTLFRSFGIILEMGTVHWIGLQMQSSIVYKSTASKYIKSDITVIMF